MSGDGRRRGFRLAGAGIWRLVVAAVRIGWRWIGVITRRGLCAEFAPASSSITGYASKQCTLPKAWQACLLIHVLFGHHDMYLSLDSRHNGPYIVLSVLGFWCLLIRVMGPGSAQMISENNENAQAGMQSPPFAMCKDLNTPTRRRHTCLPYPYP